MLSLDYRTHVLKSAGHRMLRVGLYGAVLFLAGLVYGAVVRATGVAVPCMFYLITGLKCPGCGVTRMCVALLQLDFWTAFLSHPMLLLQLPFLLIILVRNTLTYIRKGVWCLKPAENLTIYLCIGLLVIFTVLRNVWAW